MLPTPPPAVFGPLPVRVADGLGGLAFVPEPESSVVLAPGERRRALRLDVGNTAYKYGDSSRFFYQDNETQSLRLGEAWGVRGGELGITATVLGRGGGVFDPIIRWWHRNVVPFKDPVLGVPPDHLSQIEIVDGGARFHLGGSSAALTTVQLAARRALSPNWTARLALKVPIAGRRDYLDSGAVDVAASVLGGGHLTGRLHGHVNASVIVAGATRVGELEGGARRWFASVVAAEYRADGRTALVVQAEDSGFPFVRDFSSGSDRRQQMSFGLWRQAGSRDWNVSFSENIYPFRTTGFVPDIMFSIGVRERR